MFSMKHLRDASLLNLFHGETFAFKDMALSILPSLFDAAKQKRFPDKKTIILTATSGDTGSAALSGFSKLDNTYTIVLYPKHGISEFQEKQMSQFVNEKCLVYGVEGNFDDCQNIVKRLFSESTLEHSILSSANSINIGRIIPQIVYYFYAYITLVNDHKIKMNEAINFTVPTGNFGNIYAGYIAKEMGLPVNKLIIASNSNNGLTDLFQSKSYDINRPLVKTISPSMDIIISSNFERYLYHLINDPDKVNDLMSELKNNHQIDIPELNQDRCFDAYYASEEDTLKTIHSVYQQFHYLIDPHTAVAYHCYKQYNKTKDDNHYQVILSTASPYKFSDAVIKALSIKETKSLKEKILSLKQQNPNQFDMRVMDVVEGEINTATITLKDAYQTIKKVIGDIDAKN
jgi:threonine synthase